MPYSRSYYMMFDYHKQNASYHNMYHAYMHVLAILFFNCQPKKIKHACSIQLRSFQYPSLLPAPCAPSSGACDTESPKSDSATVGVTGTGFSSCGCCGLEDAGLGDGMAGTTACLGVTKGWPGTVSGSDACDSVIGTVSGICESQGGSTGSTTEGCLSGKSGGGVFANWGSASRGFPAQKAPADWA